MDSLIPWLQKHSFQAHAIALGIMVSTAAAMYFAARLESTIWIWGLMGLFILGNLLELAIR
jgi:hypothetical protein